MYNTKPEKKQHSPTELFTNSFHGPTGFMQLSSVLKTLNLATWETACDVIRVNKAALLSLLDSLVMLALWASKPSF